MPVVLPERAPTIGVPYFKVLAVEPGSVGLLCIRPTGWLGRSWCLQEKVVPEPGQIWPDDDFQPLAGVMVAPATEREVREFLLNR